MPFLTHYPVATCYNLVLHSPCCLGGRCFAALAKEQAELTARRRQEEGELAVRQKQEEAERVVRQKQEKEASCLNDLQCSFKKFSVDAEIDCSRPIERLAKNNFEWTDTHWYEKKFDHIRWSDPSRKVVTYIGDKIKYQNGFGAWTYYTYECEFDTVNKKVLDVRAHEGRLP